MKKTLLALSFVAATFGAFSQTKPVKETTAIKPAHTTENKAVVAKATPATKMATPIAKNTSKKVKAVKKHHKQAYNKFE